MNHGGWTVDRWLLELDMNRPINPPPDYDNTELINQSRPRLEKPPPYILPEGVISPIVKLNVGGVVFQTTKATLMKSDGVLRELMIKEKTARKDENGCFFIDRSPEHFQKVLDFLRLGEEVPLPKTSDKLEEVRREAKYYGLARLNQYCVQAIHNNNSQKRKNETEFGEDIRVIDNNNQLLKITMESERPVLVIYYHVDEDGKYTPPNGFNMPSFVKKYKKWLDIYFKTFTKVNYFGSSCLWHWSLHNKSGAYSHKYPDVEEPFDAQLENNIKEFLTTNPPNN